MKPKSRLLAMRPFFGILLLMAAITDVGSSQDASAKSQSSFVIHRLTIVAFFAPVKGKELKNDSDINENFWPNLPNTCSAANSSLSVRNIVK